MFGSEQNIAKYLANQLKKHVLKDGTSFAKRSNVKFRLSYRELTIALGIVVAILVYFILTVANTEATTAEILIPRIDISSTSSKSILDVATRFIFF